MIAEQLDMSPSYLNRQFRSSTGMSINDAIQHVRIDKACKLLRQSDDPVEQVAKQAGYQNIKYFFVLFKKYTGRPCPGRAWASTPPPSTGWSGCPASWGWNST